MQRPRCLATAPSCFMFPSPALGGQAGERVNFLHRAGNTSTQDTAGGLWVLGQPGQCLLSASCGHHPIFTSSSLEVITIIPAPPGWRKKSPSLH